jgi:hypothetical protein
MTDGSSDLTAASRAFSCRSSLRELTLRSQAHEHDFYAGLAASVEKASRDLADRFSKLMQDSMPGWSNPTVTEFCREASVKSELIFNWKTDLSLFRAREMETTAATSRRIASEKNRSKFAGFFGAKSGMEREYSKANAEYEIALSEEKGLVPLAKEALSKVVISGKEIMEDLMRNAASAGGSRHCPGLREELNGIALSAETLLVRFRVEQLAMAREMNGQVEILLKIYGR